MRTPDFFIVGAPRCGTTAMFEFLRAHPQIFMASVKEPHFFGADLRARYYVRTRSAYLALFAAARDEPRVGEASVRYLQSRSAAAEIREFCPSARIIIQLRDPVDLMYSSHSLRVAHGEEDIRDFEQALQAEPARRRGRRRPKGLTNPMLVLYRDTASYVRQVRRYLKAFGREQVHVIVFDDLQRDIAGTYRATLRFLDIDPDHRPEFRIVNPSPRPPMRPELRRRLRQQFRPEVERLSDLISRDLTHWSRE